jgi:hypothetical protein
MRQAATENVSDARWVSEHWWSNQIDLVGSGSTIASVLINGSRGTADINSHLYSIKRFRLPPFITIRDVGTDELVARLGLIPKHGFLAEFVDGGSYRLGWVNWWKREWAWTRESGELLLSSQRSWLGNRIEVHIEPEADTETWPILAVLELAVAKLSIPWF